MLPITSGDAGNHLWSYTVLSNGIDEYRCFLWVISNLLDNHTVLELSRHAANLELDDDVGDSADLAVYARVMGAFREGVEDLSLIHI